MSYPFFHQHHCLPKKFIGTTVNFNYPILHEGFVCSVADSTTVYRGNAKTKKWPKEAQMKRSALLSKMFKELQIGEGRTGTGGWILPKTDITLTVRPLESIKTLRDGTKAKVYAKRELEMPFVAALFSPSQRDPRLEIPARLEKNPFIFGGQSQLNEYTAKNSASIGKSFNKKVVGLVEKHIQSSDGAQKVSAGGAVRGLATFPSVKPLPRAKGYRYQTTNQRSVHRSFYSASNTARRGAPCQKVTGAACAISMSMVLFSTELLSKCSQATQKNAFPFNTSFDAAWYRDV